MNSEMDLAVLGYLLFVMPGFCLVWTYRHFTKAKGIGDFEYAAWSFLWGTILFVLAMLMLKASNDSLPTVTSKDPFLFASTLWGMGLGIVIAFSFPLGYAGALFGADIFEWLDEKLKQLLAWYKKECVKRSVH